MHPIAQSLPVHPRLLRCLGSRIAIQHQRDRQQAPNLRPVTTLARDRLQLRRRVCSIRAIANACPTRSYPRESAPETIESDILQIGNLEASVRSRDPDAAKLSDVDLIEAGLN
jgi:hypothetical protein